MWAECPTHYLRVYLAQRRRKREDDPSRPRDLLTEAGMGYRFEQRLQDLTAAHRVFDGGRQSVSGGRQIRASACVGWVGVLAATLTAALVSTGTAGAATVLFLNGTDPIPLIPVPVKPQSWMTALFDGAYATDTVINVDYPASVWPLTFDRPTMGRSIEIGATTCLGLLEAAAGEKTVVGISQGALVIDRLAGQLANNPDQTKISQVTFVAVADPNRPGGVFALLPKHTYIPILNLTNDQPAASPFDTTVIVQQYDAVANFPDRPWNVISDANALMGMVYYHFDPDWYLHVEIPSNGGVSVTNVLGGTTTTHVIPSPHLPLTQPLRDIGVPAQFVDRVDDALRPVVDAGYSQLTPDAGPHIEYGRLVWPSPNPPSGHGGASVLSSGRFATAGPATSRPVQPRPTAKATSLKPVASQSRSVLRPGR